MKYSIPADMLKRFYEHDNPSNIISFRRSPETFKRALDNLKQNPHMAAGFLAALDVMYDERLSTEAFLNSVQPAIDNDSVRELLSNEARYDLSDARKLAYTGYIPRIQGMDYDDKTDTLFIDFGNDIILEANCGGCSCLEDSIATAIAVHAMGGSKTLGGLTTLANQVFGEAYAKNHPSGTTEEPDDDDADISCGCCCCHDADDTDNGFETADEDLVSKLSAIYDETTTGRSTAEKTSEKTSEEKSESSTNPNSHDNHDREIIKDMLTDILTAVRNQANSQTGKKPETIKPDRTPFKMPSMEDGFIAELKKHAQITGCWNMVPLSGTLSVSKQTARGKSLLYTVTTLVGGNEASVKIKIDANTGSTKVDVQTEGNALSCESSDIEHNDCIYRILFENPVYHSVTNSFVSVLTHADADINITPADIIAAIDEVIANVTRH